MPPVRVPPVLPVRGISAARPAVGLPPVAGSADVEHRGAARPAAPHLAPHHGSGHRPTREWRLHRVRSRREVTWENGRREGTDACAWQTRGRVTDTGWCPSAHDPRRVPPSAAGVSMSTHRTPHHRGTVGPLGDRALDVGRGGRAHLSLWRGLRAASPWRCCSNGSRRSASAPSARGSARASSSAACMHARRI